MNVVRYEPWTLFNQLQSEINRLFERGGGDGDQSNVVTSDWLPSVDIKEEPERFVLYADMPGVDPKDIDVHMENGVLTIKGERSTETQQAQDDYKRIERLHGRFYRRFNLPDTADSEQISAKCQNGVLEIAIPKHQKVQPRKISVAH